MKLTCTVNTQIDISSYIKNHVCFKHVCKKFVPFGQEIRLRKIIYGDIVLDERLKEIQTQLNRCYNSGKVISEKKKVNIMKKNNFLSKLKKRILTIKSL